MRVLPEKLVDFNWAKNSLKSFNLFKSADGFSSYEEWLNWAEEEDQRTGMADWKEQDKTSLYDYRSIQHRHQRLKDLREEGDNRGLLYALHEGVHGNMGGMGKASLYNHANVGTKRLVEAYIDEIVTCLEHIDKTPESEISREEKQAFFDRVDHCFGRSALMLSGGARLGFFHYGVVKAMFEQGVLPKVISGSSAGSLTAAVLATHTDDELKEVMTSERLLMDAEYELSLIDRLWNPRGERLDQKHVEKSIAHLIPDLTFEEAFAKTGRHINIPIAPARKHQTSRLLNNITSPNVYIRSAVQASCAIPGVFEPVQLRAKNFNGGSQDYLPGRLWVDGSLDDDMPAKRLSRLYRVNHYIASQVNPHVVPFLTHPESRGLYDTLTVPYKAFAREWVKNAQTFGRNTKIPLPKNVRMVTDLFSHIVTQEYTADISILLNPMQIDPLRLLAKPTVAEVERLIQAGERATWPLISRIDNSTKISRAIEEILPRYHPSL